MAGAVSGILLDLGMSSMQACSHLLPFVQVLYRGSHNRASIWTTY